MKSTFLAWFSVLTVVFAMDVAGAEEKLPYSFTTHTQKVDVLTMALDPVPLLTELKVPQTLGFTLRNESDTPLECVLRISGGDTVQPLGEQEQTVTVPAAGEVKGTFSFALGEGTYSAHYPLTVRGTFRRGEKEWKIACTRVIETQIPTIPRTFSPTVVRRGGVSLLGKSDTVSYQIQGEQEVSLGAHWNGSHPETRAYRMTANMTCEGETRMAFHMHPPYRPKGGSLFLHFPVELDAGIEQPMLSYACAIRKVLPEEPESDGVTFRFWAEAEGKRQLLAEHATKSLAWDEQTVSLEGWAGKAFTMILEVNPGPRNDTTCDGCYLSGLVFHSANEAHAKKSYNAHLMSMRQTFELANGLIAHVYPGANGLLDCRLDFGDPSRDESVVSFEGISLSVAGLDLLSPSAIYVIPPAMEWDAMHDRLVCTATLLLEDEELPITLYLYEENGLLILEVPEGNPAQIGNLSLRSADKTAERVYFGHGYVVEKPTGNVVIGGGGHTLSTSHIGFEFDNGLALLLGSSTQPNAMVVSPERKVYTLELSGVTKLALVPSLKNAFDAAFQYRERAPWHSTGSAGVARKRGRLVMDNWGGKYADCAEQLRQTIAYGVKDSLFIHHLWQAWGYDVRLPDIWNPEAANPILAYWGTLEELRTLAERCAAEKIPFALHDNYIDFYPDAEGFTYDRVTFHAIGTPRRAWTNYGAQVQSYQWRPDLFQPFLLRNMKLGRSYLPTMDAYFVDVFAATGIYDFYTRQGDFHPKAETLRCWKNAFETIGRELAHETPHDETETAITISEAGSDALIGSLDGADAQWLLLSNDPGHPWTMHFPSENWARTPWFAAVNHTNFSRHGAGYGNRFNALRNGNLHGTLSDDYLSAELLGGLDLMVETGQIVSGSIRKYYLAQHVTRRLADKEITSVEYTDGDIHRTCVTWSDGTQVFVNRGETTWNVQDFALPKYGWVVFDAAGKPLAGIVRHPDSEQEIIEFSEREDSFYLYGRGANTLEILPIQPQMKRAKVLDGGKRFQVEVSWTCDAPTPKDLTIFAHVYEPVRDYGSSSTGWFDGMKAPIPTTQWGRDAATHVIETGGDHIFTVPEGTRDGVYFVMVGLYDPAQNRRYALMGEDAQFSRYSVARFSIQDGKVIGKIEPIEISETREMFSRLQANTTPAVRHGVSTLGAISGKWTADGLEILPLPVPRAWKFDVTVDESEIGFSILKVTADGVEVPVRRDAGKCTFHVEADSEPKAYMIWKKVREQ